MNIVVDKTIYTDNVISNAVYWMSSKYICIRSSIDKSSEIVSIQPRGNTSIDDSVVQEFWAIMNDQKLRDSIKSETKDIRTILYVKAFSDCDQITEEELNEL